MSDETPEADKYKDLDWLPTTADGHRIYPGKTIYTLEERSEVHRSGKTVSWLGVAKHTVRCFNVSTIDEADPIGVSPHEEFYPNDCWGSLEEAEKQAAYENQED